MDERMATLARHSKSYFPSQQPPSAAKPVVEFTIVELNLILTRKAFIVCPQKLTLQLGVFPELPRSAL